jgi:hypothetical protein
MVALVVGSRCLAAEVATARRPVGSQDFIHIDD